MSDYLNDLIGSDSLHCARTTPFRRVLGTAGNLVRWSALAFGIGFGWKFGWNLGDVATYLMWR